MTGREPAAPMNVRNARRWATGGMHRWLYAGGALAAAGVVRLLVHPWIGPIMPGTAFGIAAALTGYSVGLAPAIAVMILGLGVAAYFFVPPYGQISALDQSDLALIVGYPIVTSLIIFLIERLRRAQYRAELIGDVARSRYEMLLRDDDERVRAGRALDDTHRLLTHLPRYHRSTILIKTQTGSAKRSGRTGLGSPFAVIIPGSRHSDVHPDDLGRLASLIDSGSERIRINASGTYRTVGCVSERFVMPAGDVIVVRLDEA